MDGRGREGSDYKIVVHRVYRGELAYNVII